MEDEPRPGGHFEDLHEGDSVSIDLHPGQTTGVLEVVSDDEASVRLDGEDDTTVTFPRQWIRRI